MAKKPKQYIPKYPTGGFFQKAGDFIGNSAKLYADTQLSALGASNVIDEDAYKGSSADKFAKASIITGGIAKSALPIAAGITGAVIGGPQGAQVGMMGAKGVQGIGGALNPETDLNSQYADLNNKMASVNTATGSMSNVAMQGFGMANGGGSMPVGAIPIAKNGGIMQYTQGGINSEVEKQENSITPQGEFTQYNGPSHEQGGIKTNLSNGEMVFSDRLKLGKKTFAELNKVYNTNKEDKILEDSKANNLKKITAQLMKEAKLRGSKELFNKQESLKEERMMKYGGRIGYKFPDGGKKTIDRAAYSQDFQRFDKSGAGNYDIAGAISDVNFKNLGFTKATDVTDKYPVWTKDGRYLIRNDAGTGYVSAGDAKSLRYVGQQPVVQPQQTSQSFDLGKKTDMNRTAFDFQYADKGITGYQDDTTKEQYYIDQSGNKVDWNNYKFNYGGIKKYPLGGEEISYIPPNPNDVTEPMGGLNDAQVAAFNQSLLKGQSEFVPVQNTPTQGGMDNGQWANIAKQIGLGLGQNMGNIYDLKRGSTADTQSYERVTPNTLDPRADLQYNDLQFRKGANDLRNASVGNSSTYIQNRKDLALNQMLANSRIRQQYENQNAQIKNQAGMFNAQTQRAESDANLANQAQARNLKGSAYSNIGQNIMGQYKDTQSDKRDQEYLEMLKKTYPQFGR